MFHNQQINSYSQQIPQTPNLYPTASTSSPSTNSTQGHQSTRANHPLNPPAPTSNSISRRQTQQNYSASVQTPRPDSLRPQPTPTQQRNLRETQQSYLTSVQSLIQDAQNIVGTSALTVEQSGHFLEGVLAMVRGWRQLQPELGSRQLQAALQQARRLQNQGGRPIRVVPLRRLRGSLSSQLGQIYGSGLNQAQRRRVVNQRAQTSQPTGWTTFPAQAHVVANPDRTDNGSSSAALNASLNRISIRSLIDSDNPDSATPPQQP